MNDTLLDGRLVAVTGASGFIGAALCAKLKERGFIVRAFAGPHSDITLLRTMGLEIIQGGLRDSSAIAQLLEGAEGVFHLAGVTGHTFKLDTEYWDVNCTATKELLQAAAGKGVKRFIFCSTADVHGHIPNPPANEDTPLATDDIYQITKEHGEQAALAANGKKGMKTTVIRPSKVYGPGDMRGLAIFKGIAGGSFTMYGDGENSIHPVYISDLVEALILAYESEKAPGQAYIIAGQESVTLNKMVQIIAGTAEVELHARHLPGVLFRAYSSVCQTVCSFFSVEPPISRRYVDIFVKNHSYSIKKAVSELGYQPKVGLEQGARLTYDWYRDKGLI
ncbi:MAG: NAD-dependent epimerase/dehydratase family protein [Nitrospinota bacterium]|nr:NAD-dependent epimerase/dehydratase family protein [Nitrospinota bacterium]